MLDFGEILATVGDFGVFQKVLMVALTFPNFLLQSVFCSLLFVESDPVRRCNTDWILDADANLTTDEQLNLTVPRDEDGTFSRCQMFVPVNWSISVIREYGLNETTACQNGSVYFSTLYEATTVTDFDLVCDKSFMVEIVQTVFLSGSFFGAILFGPAAESFGRKRGTQLPAALLLIFVLVSSFSPNFYVYIMSQFVIGISFGGYRTNCVVLATEWTGVTKRSYAACLNQIFGALGQCAMALLVYHIRDWRKTQLVLAVVQTFVFIYIWWVPESARWLMGNGRNEEAQKLIHKVAAINKKNISDNIFLTVTEEKEKEKEKKVPTQGIKYLFSSPAYIKYLFIISSAWFSLNLGYYCLVLNVGKFGLSIFLVQFLFGISEIPAHLICALVLEKVGRKVSLISTLLAGGTFCLLTLVIPQDNAIVVTALVTTGKFFLNWGGSVCMVYIQELFPTSIRQTAVGLGYMLLRIAGLMSPLLNMLGRFHTSIPVAVFSSLAVISGGLSLLLPETMNKELID